MHKVYFDEEKHLYFLDQKRTKPIPSVSELLSHFGYADFGRVNPEVLEKACAFGIVAHKTLALFDKGQLGAYDKQLEPIIQGWLNFQEDHDCQSFELVETPLVSKVWQFAGTPDRVTKKALPDIKTGAETEAHALQTALYVILARENLGLKIERRMSVYLNPSFHRGYKISVHTKRSDFTLVKCMLQIYADKRKRGLL